MAQAESIGLASFFNTLGQGTQRYYDDKKAEERKRKDAERKIMSDIVTDAYLKGQLKRSIPGLTPAPTVGPLAERPSLQGALGMVPPQPAPQMREPFRPDVVAPVSLDGFRDIIGDVYSGRAKGGLPQGISINKEEVIGRPTKIVVDAQGDVSKEYNYLEENKLKALTDTKNEANRLKRLGKDASPSDLLAFIEKTNDLADYSYEQGDDASQRAYEDASKEATLNWVKLWNVNHPNQKIDAPDFETVGSGNIIVAIKRWFERVQGSLEPERDQFGFYVGEKKLFPDGNTYEYQGNNNWE